MRPIDLSMQGRVVVVTGGASGIGEAVVRRLADGGASVVLADVDEHRGRRLQSELDTVRFVKTDVASEASVNALFDGVAEDPGRLDSLVNAAAWLHPRMYEPFLEQPLEHWDRSQNVNFRGVMLTCRRALPLLEKTRGSVVNITSVGACRVFANGAAYCASKAAVEHMTRCLALDWAPRGVRINALAPGYIDTPGVQFATNDHEALQSVIDAKIPIGRLGAPDEMAQAVLFLISPMASYVTGSTLLADGGWALT